MYNSNMQISLFDVWLCSTSLARISLLYIVDVWRYLSKRHLIVYWRMTSVTPAEFFGETDLFLTLTASALADDEWEHNCLLKNSLFLSILWHVLDKKSLYDGILPILTLITWCKLAYCGSLLFLECKIKKWIQLA